MQWKHFKFLKKGILTCLINLVQLLNISSSNAALSNLVAIRHMWRQPFFNVATETFWKVSLYRGRSYFYQISIDFWLMWPQPNLCSHKWGDNKNFVGLHCSNVIQKDSTWCRFPINKVNIHPLSFISSLFSVISIRYPFYVKVTEDF